MHARNIRLELEYDGTDFAGWQVQPAKRTVQGVLEEAFADLVGGAVRVVGAGRTDAGVHALGQVSHTVCSITLPCPKIAAALNARLPEDVHVKSADDADPDFHARFSAVSRTYMYLIGLSPSPIWRRHRLLVRSKLDVDAMKEALTVLAGRHDFSSFCLSGGGPAHHGCEITEISLESERRFGGMLILEVTADRFLRGMVRSIVGTLVEVGKGTLRPGAVPAILDARDRASAGPTAPAKGLYLVRVSHT